MFRKQTDIKAF